jgi:hypothetical protein
LLSLLLDLRSILVVFRLNRAGALDHLLDLTIRDHHRAGAVREDVLAGYNPYAGDDDRNVHLERGHLLAAPLDRLAGAVCGKVIAGQLVEGAQATVGEHSGAAVFLEPRELVPAPLETSV